MTAARGSWNFDETRRLVGALHGEPQAELLSPCLDSLRARQFYAAYHLANFEQLVVDRLMDAPEGWTPARLVLAATEEEAKQNQLLRSRLAAEATACAASLHCLLDTLAHAVAYALGMNLGAGALTEQGISRGTVKERLKKSGDAPAIALALGMIDQSDDVIYLNALVNHSKHRSVIRPGFWFDATAQMTSFSIEFERFAFGLDKGAKPEAVDKRKWHERREVKSALEKAHSAMSHWIVEAGQRLNDELAMGAAAA